MSDPKADSSNKRMAGRPLQVAARLAETPGAGALIYGMAVRDLGIDQLHEADVPRDAAPYRPLHLGGGARPPQGGRSGATEEQPDG